MTIGRVVGEELGEQRDAEQRQEDDEAPVAAPVGLEVAPAARVDRGEPEAIGPAPCQAQASDGVGAVASSGGGCVLRQR